VNGAAAAVGHKPAGITYQFVPDDKLHELGRPDWAVTDMLPHRGLGIVFGYRGDGKTFFLLDLAASMATGRSFCGRAARQGWVCYIGPEGAYSLHARLQAWKSAHGHQGPIGLAVLPRSIQLLNLTESILPLASAIDQVQGFSGPPALIIVDTLSRNAPGIRENTQEDMSLVIASCDYLRDRFACTVVLGHHTRKGDSELRGSSVLDGAADTCILLKRDGRTITVSCVKQKDAEEFSPFTLELVKVESSCALAPSNEEARPDVLPDYCHEVLRVLADISTSEGVSTTTWMRSATQGTKLSERNFYRARKLLVAKGYAMRVHGASRYAVAPEGQELLSLPNHCHVLPLAARSRTATTAEGRSPDSSGSDQAQQALG
jgi:hypothetical protein